MDYSLHVKITPKASDYGGLTLTYCGGMPGGG
jgi:hypothetical protein